MGLAPRLSASTREVWRATICVAGEKRLLGRFADPVDAAKAYDDAAREHFGPFACVNFPRSGERGCGAVSERTKAAQRALHEAAARVGREA